MPQHKRDPYQKSAIVAKATEVLDAYGIADLTMRRLARELDVTVGALYWHFTSKQELLGAVADELLRPAVEELAGLTGDWPDVIGAVARRLRDALLSRTDGAELVSAGFAAGQSTAVRVIVDRLGAAAAEAGLTGDQPALAARTVVYYVLGFTVDEQSRLQWDAAGAALPGDSPVLDDDAGTRFAFGLMLLIDGIAARCGTSACSRLTLPRD
ncbi:TetR family transcriptional regulator [Mycolicibacterium insubricum]|mgnify:CR=1 FL=1|uniref:TetR family transcriptional regulator n=1 Tax=Mycolicibacterium insubricum TaxID=444597 RepID=A0A1X0DHX1_9MYCO|nr:TetR family transcriptional regulator [Mycolicibacterium insubricum]ORA71450.1 TetR family transcriptional regulator [Mycolicibacterium insubricum]BBZ67075.1 TetR family transcriptional regulator [Mycolicibacterium insubricum]